MLGAVIAVLPVMAAGAVVISTSKDMNEVAFAMLAVAGLLSLAGIGLLWTLRNAQAHLETRNTETRHLVLALTRSMKHLAQRVGGLEASTQADMRLPDWMPGAANMPAPAPPVLIEKRLLTVPQRRLAGIEIVAEWGPSGADAISAGYRLMGAEGDVIERIEAAAALAGRPLLPDNAFILVSIGQPLAEMPLAVEAILALMVARPHVAARLVIGISQRALRLGGNSEAQALARLARAGLRLMLDEVTDVRLDGEALAACRFGFVRIEARRLLAVAEAGDTVAPRLGAVLAARGITLIAGGIDEARQVPELIDLAVMLVEGPALGRQPARISEAPALHPSPPAPARPPAPAVVLSEEDRARFRAAG